MSLGTISKLTWPAPGFANELKWGFRGDNPIADTRPMIGSEKEQYVSGEQDAWTTGRMYTLDIDLRYVPTDVTTNPPQTGFEDVDGVKDFFESMQDANQCRFYPDASGSYFVLSYLDAPYMEAPTLEPDGTRRWHLTLTNVSQSYAI